MPDTVLVITNKQDETADYLEPVLRRRAPRYYRFNTEEYPRNIQASVSIGDCTHGGLFERAGDDAPLRAEDIVSTWYRRPMPAVINVGVEDSGIRQFAANEANEFLRGVLYSMDCRWVSHPLRIRYAEHKIVQLKHASRLGLHVPSTCVTNSPRLAREFWSACSGRVVAKPVYMGFVESHPPQYIYTTIVSESDFEAMDSVALTPVIFQELVSKRIDVRVTVVGGKAYAAAIESRLNSTEVPDWRATQISALRHTVHDLPNDISDVCIRLVKDLGLTFGAIDLGLTYNGDYMFFEVNPNGQWAWIEQLTGLPISNALADLLVEGVS